MARVIQSIGQKEGKQIPNLDRKKAQGKDPSKVGKKSGKKSRKKSRNNPY